MWKDLNQKEKFDIIRDYIQKGFNDLDDIVNDYNSGLVNQFGYGGGVDNFLNALQKKGYKYRVTSGWRPGSKTSSGKPSYHAIKGGAKDIVVDDFEGFLQSVYSDPELVNLMRQYGIGILEETTPDVMKRTRATGKHLHIGPDTWAVQMRDNRIKMNGMMYHPMQDVTWQDVQARKRAMDNQAAVATANQLKYYQSMLSNNPVLDDDIFASSVQQDTSDPFDFMDTEFANHGKEMMQAYMNVLNSDSTNTQPSVDLPSVDDYQVYFG